MLFWIFRNLPFDSNGSSINCKQLENCATSTYNQWELQKQVTVLSHQKSINLPLISTEKSEENPFYTNGNPDGSSTNVPYMYNDHL